jgi:hypothetical protein
MKKKRLNDVELLHKRCSQPFDCMLRLYPIPPVPHEKCTSILIVLSAHTSRCCHISALR